MAIDIEQRTLRSGGQGSTITRNLKTLSSSSSTLSTSSTLGTSVRSFTLGAGELELWAFQNSHFGKGEKLRTLVGHLHDHNSRDLQGQSGLMQHASA